MRESLLDRAVERSTEGAVYRMLPEAHVIKIGGRSILDAGRDVVFPVVETLAEWPESHKLILATSGGEPPGESQKPHKLLLGPGGGVRPRHVFSIGIDLGLPTGVLAQLAQADALANAHILGTLLAPYGVIAIPPEIFGHLLPLLIHAAPGVVFSSVPPYSLWEHPPGVGRIPPHRTDAGAFLLAECFGCKSLTLIKDVDGLYDADPKREPGARFIPEIGVSELRRLGLATIPFEPVVLELLENARLLDRFQIVNGLEPARIAAALAGEHVGTIVHR